MTKQKNISAEKNLSPNLSNQMKRQKENQTNIDVASSMRTPIEAQISAPPPPPSPLIETDSPLKNLFSIPKSLLFSLSSSFNFFKNRRPKRKRSISSPIISGLLLISLFILGNFITNCQCDGDIQIIDNPITWNASNNNSSSSSSADDSISYNEIYRQVESLQPKVFAWFDATATNLMHLDEDGNLTNWIALNNYHLITQVYSNDYSSPPANLLTANVKSDIPANQSLQVSTTANQNYVQVDYQGENRAGFTIPTDTIDNAHNIKAWYYVTEFVPGNGKEHITLGFADLRYTPNERFIAKGNNISSYFPQNIHGGVTTLGDSIRQSTAPFEIPNEVHLLSARNINVSKSALEGFIGTFPINANQGGQQKVRELLLFTNDIDSNEHSNIVHYLYHKWNISTRTPFRTNIRSDFNVVGNNGLANATDGDTATSFRMNMNQSDNRNVGKVIYEHRLDGSVLDISPFIQHSMGVSKGHHGIELRSIDHNLKIGIGFDILRNDHTWQRIDSVSPTSINGVDRKIPFNVLGNDCIGFRFVFNQTRGGTLTPYINELYWTEGARSTLKVMTFNNNVNSKIFNTNTEVLSSGFSNYLRFNHDAYDLTIDDFSIENGTAVSLTALNDGKQEWALVVRPTALDSISSDKLTITIPERNAVSNVYGQTLILGSRTQTLRFKYVNPLSEVITTSGYRPAFGDLDADGDLDLVFSKGSSINSINLLDYFSNTGSASIEYSNLTGSANPFNGLDAGNYITGVTEYAIPTISDVDSDEDLDLIIGIHNTSGNGFLCQFFSNNGDFSFTEKSSATDNPFHDLNVNASSPVFVDIDGDGDEDFFSGELSGRIYFYSNQGTNIDFTNRYVQKTGITNNPFHSINYGYSTFTVPAFTDIDDDGDMDMICGTQNGNFNFFSNRGTNIAMSNRYVQQTGADVNPLHHFDVGSGARPTFVDIDGDGDMDLASGAYGSSSIDFFYNINGIFIEAE